MTAPVFDKTITPEDVIAWEVELAGPCPDYPPTDWLPPFEDGYDPEGEDDEFGEIVTDDFGRWIPAGALLLGVTLLSFIAPLFGG